jgi:hypothetical protein
MFTLYFRQEWNIINSKQKQKVWTTKIGGLHYCMFLLLGTANLAPYNSSNKINIWPQWHVIWSTTINTVNTTLFSQSCKFKITAPSSFSVGLCISKPVVSVSSFLFLQAFCEINSSTGSSWRVDNYRHNYEITLFYSTQISVSHKIPPLHSTLNHIHSL